MTPERETPHPPWSACFSALPLSYKVLPHAQVELPEFQKGQPVGLVPCPGPVTLGRSKRSYRGGRVSKAYRYRQQAALGPRAGCQPGYKAASDQVEKLRGFFELQFVSWYRAIWQRK